MSSARFVEVYRAKNPVEAHLIKDQLEAAGIAVQVAEEAVNTVYPGIWWASPRILVKEAETANAAVLIREFEAAQKARAIEKSH
jgi:signal recognition particle subunit SEC65